jgi:PAS domain-containing protein
MTTAWSITEDILPWLGFTTAMVMVLLMPVRAGGPVSRGAKWFFLVSIACYMTGMTASILTHFMTIPAAVQTIVDDVEVLWIPFILFGVYSMYARQQLNDAYAAQQSVEQTSEMMESIVETTPAGIVVLDATGWITFANSAARRLLDLEEDPDLCSVRTPGWLVRCGETPAATEPRSDFRDLVTALPVEGLPITVEWPNGWKRRLSVNSEPVRSGDGQVTGAIVAFIDAESRTALA